MNKALAPSEINSVDFLALIEGHVQSELNGRVRDFQLRVEGDGLVLRGYSRTFYAKQLAQHAVMNHANMPISANEIEVQ